MKSVAAFCMLVSTIAGCAGSAASPASQGGATAASPESWRTTLEPDRAKYTVFQRQLNSWDGFTMAGHAAVSVQPPGSQTPVGARQFGAKTKVDRLAWTVTLTNLTVERVTFPSAPSLAASYQHAFQALFVKGPLTIALDRMEAALALLHGGAVAKSVPMQNPVPLFVFSSTPAVLVTIDGDPVWHAVAGTPYQRVLNARPLLLRDSAGTVYVHLFDGFLQAAGLAGPLDDGVFGASRDRQGGRRPRRERRSGPDGRARGREDAQEAILRGRCAAGRRGDEAHGAHHHGRHAAVGEPRKHGIAPVNGNVYRNTGNGWEEHNSSGGWSHTSGANAQSMENEMRARHTGEQRSWASSAGHGWGGGGRRR
jgi:hypothetical protein